MYLCILYVYISAAIAQLEEQYPSDNLIHDRFDYDDDEVMHSCISVYVMFTLYIYYGDTVLVFMLWTHCIYIMVILY